MSKKIRDYLFIVFIVFFIAGTILTSLYASGFQINFSWPLTFNRLLIKTGMIAVKTNPAGSTAYLNKHPQVNFSLNPWKMEYLTTPTKIKNVLPGEYTLELKLPGYLPLTKKITVYSGQTTFAEDINLFSSNLPQLITIASSSDIIINANYTYLYLPATSEIVDLQNEQKKILNIASSSTGVWLKNNNQLLTDGKLFNSSGDQQTNYHNILGSNANNWYYDESKNRLYYQNNNSINYLDINSQASTMIVSGDNYLSYEPRTDLLFLVAVKNEKTILQIYSLKTQKIEQSRELPAVGHYTFIHENHSRLTLYDDQNKTLYLINPDNIKNDIKIIQGVISWQWINDQSLFYNNNWEIYHLDLQQNNESLLTRVGEKIVKIIWNENANYLIFSTADSLNAYDPVIGLITKIFTANSIKPLTLNNTNNTLYFWANIGRQNGIYSLQLQ